LSAKQLFFAAIEGGADRHGLQG